MTTIGVCAAVGAVLVSAAPARRAADVVDALGVNVHIEYTDSDYRDLNRVLADLRYLGVRNVRDAAPNPANQGQGGYEALARAGVRYDLFINGEPIAPALERIDSLQRTVPGSVLSVEGPNEVNNLHGFTFAGEKDPHRAATLYQASLYAQARADPTLKGVPVLAFTDWPYTFGRADVQNEHPYIAADRAPGPALKPIVAAARQRAPDAPLIFTETGYSTSASDGDVSELAQSRLLLISLLEAESLGVRRVFAYQLLDAYPDPTGHDHEKHFGLFTTGGAPKRGAQMLRRLTLLLADHEADASTFSIRPFAMSILGGPADLRTLRIEKAGGDEILAIWRAEPLFDAYSRQDLELAASAVDVRLPRGHGPVTITDPVAGEEGSAHGEGALVRITLGSDPVLIHLGVAGGG